MSVRQMTEIIRKHCQHAVRAMSQARRRSGIRYAAGTNVIRPIDIAILLIIAAYFAVASQRLRLLSGNNRGDLALLLASKAFNLPDDAK